jgi:hypothetical protein
VPTNDEKWKSLGKRYRERFPHGLVAAWDVQKRGIPKKLAGMTDAELANWQAAEMKRDEGSAECILAEQEWQRRLLARQISGMRSNMIRGALIGFLLTIGTALILETIGGVSSRSPARQSHTTPQQSTR